MSDPCRNIKPACAQNGGANDPCTPSSSLTSHHLYISYLLHVLGLAKCNRQTKRRLRSSILSIGDQDLQWRRIPRDYQDIHLPLVDLEKTISERYCRLYDYRRFANILSSYVVTLHTCDLHEDLKLTPTSYIKQTTRFIYRIWGTHSYKHEKFRSDQSNDHVIFVRICKHFNIY